MGRKFETCSTYENEDGKRVYDVVVEDKKIEGLTAIQLDSIKCQKCKEYHDGCDRKYVVRTFDCAKNVKTLQGVFGIATGIAFAAIVVGIFSMLQFGFFAKLGLSILAFVGLDIISTNIEEFVPRLYDAIYYRKLKKVKARNEKLEEAARKEQEALRQKQEAERLANERYYDKVQKARITVKELRDISDQYDYGPNEKKISTCVEICEAMLQKLEEDSSSYIAVKPLFDVYIPAFLVSLAQYVELANTDTEMEEHEKALTECVDVILQYVEQKSKGDQQTAKTMFTASANALKNQLRRELDK